MKSLLERAEKLLVGNDGGLSGMERVRWLTARAQWLRDYNNRCRADFHGGDVMPDHRGCPSGAECEGKRDDIYWRPEGT